MRFFCWLTARVKSAVSKLDIPSEGPPAQAGGANSAGIRYRKSLNSIDLTRLPRPRRVAVDHPSPLPQTASPSIADPEIRYPDVESLPEFDHLCEWFDRRLELLEQQFAAFQTKVSKGR